MDLKILVIDTYYEKFLTSFYASNRPLGKKSYQKQKRLLLEQCFGTSDFYSANLNLLGHEAEDIIANCEPLQKSWAQEQGLPWNTALTSEQKNHRLLRVLKAQIKSAIPDVLYLQNLNWPGPEFLRQVKPYVKLAVGQIAYGLNPHLDLSPYDLILTSFPHFVDRFRHMGGNSEYFRIGFEKRVLDRLGDTEQCYPAVFAGTFSNSTGPHGKGTRLLEYISSRAPIHFWGQGIESLSYDSPIRRKFHGEAWGIDMYRALAQGRIVLNRHAEWSENYANNMRLYEATGVGAMLITDYKDNLGELFEIGKEVFVYRNKYECSELLTYYLEHEEERSEIATAGQRRTLHEHTYYHRMQELEQILDQYLRHPDKTTARRFPMPGGNGKPARPPFRQECLEIAKSTVKRTPFVNQAHFLWRRMQCQGRDTYQLTNPDTLTPELDKAWQNPDIPEKQRERVDWELAQMYMGNIPSVFRVAAQAVASTGAQHGTIAEVGCASGYYYEVLKYFLGHKIHYTGVDYSRALILQAQNEYPEVPFMTGDAVALPLGNQCFDVAISGCVLLHLQEYEKAIAETARIARTWCIFHRTPILLNGQTTYLKKLAYEVPVVELVFNEQELLRLFSKYGMEPVSQFYIGNHKLSALKERVHMKTYVCKKITPSLSVGP